MEKKFEQDVMEIAKVLDDKKAEDVILIDVHRATILADTFVVCSGNSPNQVKMLAEELEAAMAKRGLFKRRIEGQREGRWIVLDFGHILVHIFHKQEREFYDIERLWRTDGNFLKYSESLQEPAVQDR